MGFYGSVVFVEDYYNRYGERVEVWYDPWEDEYIYDYYGYYGQYLGTEYEFD